MKLNYLRKFSLDELKKKQEGILFTIDRWHTRIHEQSKNYTSTLRPVDEYGDRIRNLTTDLVKINKVIREKKGDD